MTKEPVIHIAHLVWHFSTGGLENGLVNLINHLPHQQFKHSIITLTGHDAQFAKRITASNVEIFTLNKAQGHDWGTFSRLNTLLKQLKPDILHSRNLGTLELQTVGFWRKIPMRIHGEHGWDSHDIGGVNKKNRLIRRLFKAFVHRYVCLSSESEHYLINAIKVNKNKIERICNGVEINKYAHAEPAQLDISASGYEPSSTHDSNKKTPVLFASVGRLATVKNHELLIKAYALLVQNYPDISEQTHLVLVGDGPCKDSLHALTKKLNLTDKVLFTGNRQDIPNLMKSFDVFVLPSLAEGISNTILEAMAAGTPVIATKVGGNADLLPEALHSTNLVSSTSQEQLMQAMLRYLNEPAALTADAQLVKNHCHQHFSIDTMVNRYKKLYEQTRM